MNFSQRGYLAAQGSACLKKVFAMLDMPPPTAVLLLMLLVLEVLPWA